MLQQQIGTILMQKNPFSFKVDLILSFISHISHLPTVILSEDFATWFSLAYYSKALHSSRWFHCLPV